MPYQLSLTEAAEQRQKTAIHEAGHAVVLFAFQVPAFYGIELSTIDALRSDEDGYSGMVRMAEWYASVRALDDQLSPTQRRALNLFDMMNSMGGPLAEAVFSDQSLLDYYPEHWLHEVLNGFDNGFEKDRYMIERAACSLVGEQSRQQERLIIKVANWIEELFSNPAVEDSIKQLAKTLYDSNNEFTGFYECWAAMSKGWGTRSLPMTNKKWRRKFAALYKIHALKLATSKLQG